MTTVMNILFVTEYFPPKIMGGGEINVSILAKALANNGMDVQVLTSYHQGLQKYELVDKVKVHRTLATADNPHGIRNNLKRSWSFPGSVVREVRKIVTERKIEAIHFIGASIIAAPKLKHLNIPLFATIESFPTLCPKGDRIYHGKEECKVVCTFSKFVSCQRNSAEIGKIENKFYLKYNPVSLSYVYTYYKKLNEGMKYCNLIAISEYVKELLAQQGLKSTVIPNALDVGRYYQNQSKSSLLGKVKVLYLGSLTTYKGPQVVLKALQGLQNYHCDLYGDGPLQEELQKMIKDNNLAAEIHKPVPYTKIPELYASADIIVLPSIWPEPFGRIAIEAMAAGKPVIGSDIGAIKELIADGAGILVKPGDVDGFHNAIAELITDRKKREKMGELGRIAAANYDEQLVMMKFKALYQGVQ